MTDRSGATIAGYEVITQLGSGGMSSVYLVQHPRLPRREALKLMARGLSSSPDYRARFAREADTLAALDHPNVVRVHDRGEFDGQLWLTMQFAPGVDAAELLRSRGPLPLPLVVVIVDAVADALDYVWSKARVAHRDVKPANIVVELTGDAPSVKLVDFGIAKSGSEAVSLTSTGHALGTLTYLAPEAILGRPTDDRADQYALACTAYQLLTGRPPFDGDNPASIMNAHLHTQMPPPSAVTPLPPHADQAILRAATKAPDQRFGSCREFAAAFRSRPPTAVLSPPAPARSASWTPTPPAEQPAPAWTAPSASPAPRHRAAWLLGLGALASAAVVVTAAVLLGSTDDSTRAASNGDVPGRSTSSTSPSTDLSELAGDWTGSYTCNQGDTSLALKISADGPDQLAAVFDFGPTSDNPEVPRGSFGLRGRLSGDDLVFNPTDWIVRPNGYEMVGLRVTGPVDPTTPVLSGTVTYAGCSSFRVTRSVRE